VEGEVWRLMSSTSAAPKSGPFQALDHGLQQPSGHGQLTGFGVERPIMSHRSSNGSAGWSADGDLIQLPVSVVTGRLPVLAVTGLRTYVRIRQRDALNSTGMGAQSAVRSQLPIAASVRVAP
jgi:hypothetical protein